jgi:hypothetical protein
MKYFWLLALSSVAIVMSTAAADAECGPPVAIRFAAGASAADLTDGIARGEIDCYTLTAGAGQRMTLLVGSVERNAVISVYPPGWKLSRDADQTWEIAGTALTGIGDTDRWSGPLPPRGQYLIVVGSSRGGAEYNLRVEIR